ncbi:M20/M25/M40 family metallo-hydrolase [Brevibacterium aurantiacum]|uniref:M20/M25/M40 family metallo-hydrolase n=1 Tax=Brevibacterium aurantiacum TaxID=273384 RepID=UPI001F49D2E6|nr:M20/M25/M40 family metallo-hydrolase [Brevibacterium aurantiacum]
MDALPIQEQTDEPFTSANANMHACGHDLHTAGLVGAVELLHAHRAELAGDVVFMFQPGEEGYNGASVMIKEGVLDAAGPRVIAAYGAHVHMGAKGVVSTKAGPLQAGSNVLNITSTGAGVTDPSRSRRSIRSLPWPSSSQPCRTWSADASAPSTRSLCP